MHFKKDLVIGKCFIGAKTILLSQICIGFYDDFDVFRFICGQQSSSNFSFFIKNFNFKSFNNLLILYEIFFNMFIILCWKYTSYNVVSLIELFFI